MKKIFLLLLAAICFIACQKEITDSVDTGGDNNGGNNDTSNVLIGTWTFDSLHSEFQTSSVVIADTTDDSTASNYQYSSYGNNGTLTIDDSLFKIIGLTYSISTTLPALLYENGQLIRSDSIPFNYYVPPTNTSIKYQLIDTESVYFPEGGFFDTSTTSKPSEFRYKIEGNLLTFTQQVNSDTTLVVSGITKHDKVTGTGYLYFHKK